MNGGSDLCTYHNGTVVGDPVCACTDEYYGKYCQHKRQQSGNATTDKMLETISLG